jgi:hypothetical protein
MTGLVRTPSRMPAGIAAGDWTHIGDSRISVPRSVAGTLDGWRTRRPYALAAGDREVRRNAREAQWGASPEGRLTHL